MSGQGEAVPIAGRVENLAEALVLCDPSSPDSLLSVGKLFEEIAALAIEAGKSEVVLAAARAAQFLEEAGKGSRPVDTLFPILERTVAAIQAVICQGRPGAEASFPPELESGGVAPAPASNEKASPARPSRRGRPASRKSKRFHLPAHIDAAIFTEFLTRQTGVLEEFEALTLTLEKSADGAGSNAIRRILHTLKGEAGLLGLNDVERLCHHCEDRMAKDSSGKLADYLLRVKDWLGRSFEHYAGKGSVPEGAETLMGESGSSAQLAAQDAPAPDKAAALPEPQPPAPPPPLPAQPLPQKTADAAVHPMPTDATELQLLKEFVTEAKEHLDNADVQLLTLEMEPENQEAINTVFRCFHTIKGVANCLGVADIPAVAHEAESLLDRARKGTLRLEGPTIDVTFDAVDTLKHQVATLTSALSSGEPVPADPSMPSLLERLKAIAAGNVPPAPARRVEPSPKKLGEILVEKGVVTEDVVEAVLRKQENSDAAGKLGEQLIREGQVPAREVAEALRAQRANQSGTALLQIKDTIKVDADRLDRLVDAIGELVIAESMVSQSAELRDGASPVLARQLSQLDKITRELQEMGTSLRMVPVRPVFQKMARLVRDLAKKVGKPVEFIMAGEDTELDKTVVEKISDPLVHMVRNSVDHGLEADAEARRAAGKSETGHVTLRAYHKGGSIYIEVEDDGRGLDRDAILAKGRERGLIREGEVLSDRDVYNLVFLPGFSTAKVVTDVSGRGVGMDVVRRNIEALRGQVDIRTEKGKGTVFTIRLPLTLAIIDGMVLSVGRERYIIPTLSILRSIRPTKQDLSTVLGRGEMLTLQGRLIPLFRLDRLFNVAGAQQEPTQALVIVIEDEGRQAGLVADELLGQQQTVIKSLGEGMRNLAGISGGAIMPDGQVGLILDVGGLVRLAHSSDAKHGNADGAKASEAAA